MIKKFIQNFFNLSKKQNELKVKNAELENRIIQNSVELQILKKSLDDCQKSLNLLLSANASLSNEIATIYEIIKSMMSDRDIRVFPRAHSIPISFSTRRL